MELVFLFALLIGIAWWNRRLLGFDRNSCDWMSADKPGENGDVKWMCRTHGTIVTTDGSTPPDCT